MHVKPIAFGILTIALFAGTIGVTMASGTWQTTGRTSAGAGADGGGGAASDTGSGTGSGAGAGSAPSGATSDDVKGWMAIGDVATASGAGLAEILAAFALPADTPPGTAVKDLESDLFSVTALRAWLAGRSGPAGAASDPPATAGTPAP